MMKCSTLFLFACITPWLVACTDDEKKSPYQKPPVPWVKTIQVYINNQSTIELSGVIHARFETPVAFQLSGRITTRHVNAGQHVKKGQKLFELDTRDLKQSILTAEAEYSAAQAAFATITTDVERDLKLLTKNFISKQALERTELTQQEAKARLNAAYARLQQTKNALTYADLRAEEAGILIEVNGEPGQVVTFGQAIAILAHDGEKEVEVFFPENVKPHQSGIIRLTDNSLSSIELRESAGAANTASRTWRARYRIIEKNHSLSLGRVVRTSFTKDIETTSTYKIPLGALDERGEETHIWQLLHNQAHPVPTEIIKLDTEHAWVTADIPEGSHIITLGTNQLKAGMEVQALTP